MLRRDGTTFWASMTGRNVDASDPSAGSIWTFQDVTRHVELERSREQALTDLKAAMESVKTLSGLLPICSYCHRIRNDAGEWERLEGYIGGHTNAQLSHGMCPECYTKNVPAEYR